MCLLRNTAQPEKTIYILKNGNKKTTIKKIPKKISVYEKQSVTITRGGVGNCKEELTGKTC